MALQVFAHPRRQHYFSGCVSNPRSSSEDFLGWVSHTKPAQHATCDGALRFFLHSRCSQYRTIRHLRPARPHINFCSSSERIMCDHNLVWTLLPIEQAQKPLFHRFAWIIVCFPQSMLITLSLLHWRRHRQPAFQLLRLPNSVLLLSRIPSIHAPYLKVVHVRCQELPLTSWNQEEHSRSSSAGWFAYVFSNIVIARRRCFSTVLVLLH